MINIKWTDDALACASKIYFFYAYDLGLPDIGEKALKTIYGALSILSNEPEAGRPAEDLEPEHRELIVKFGKSGFSCVYEVWPEFVLILAIKHQKEIGYKVPW